MIVGNYFMLEYWDFMTFWNHITDFIIIIIIMKDDGPKNPES